jgi:hypothetical protein
MHCASVSDRLHDGRCRPTSSFSKNRVLSIIDGPDTLKTIGRGSLKGNVRTAAARWCRARTNADHRSRTGVPPFERVFGGDRRSVSPMQIDEHADSAVKIGDAGDECL